MERVLSLLVLAAFVSLPQGDARSVGLAVTYDQCSGVVDNHVQEVKCQHQMAIKKGEVAARIWRVEQDIQKAKAMCIMTRPEAMPSTTARQPVKGDWMRPKHAQKKSMVCLPLRWKKFEDDAKCAWQMTAEDKAQVLVIQEAGSSFRLANPRDGRQSAMTSWENWRYDDTVLVGMKEEATNLKMDCEKVIFSLYSSQTDIKDVSEEIQELHGKTVQGKLQDLQDKISIADQRLEEVYDLKHRFDQVCR